MTELTHKSWLQRFTLPAIGLTAIVFGWGTFVGAYCIRSAGIATVVMSPGGQMVVGGGTIQAPMPIPMSLMDQIMAYGVEGIMPTAFLHVLLLMILFIGRVRFQWWCVGLCLLLIGTPLALYSHGWLADYLYQRNHSGFPLEDFAPQFIGVAAAWLLSMPLAAVASRYRVTIVRRSDDATSPCPRCGYDLYYGSSDTCPECGWTLPPAVRTALVQHH